MNIHPILAATNIEQHYSLVIVLLAYAVGGCILYYLGKEKGREIAFPMLAEIFHQHGFELSRDTTKGETEYKLVRRAEWRTLKEHGLPPQGTLGWIAWEDGILTYETLDKLQMVPEELVYGYLPYSQPHHPKRCVTCNTLMVPYSENDPSPHEDCGGECLTCAAKAGDPECIEVLKSIQG